MSAGAPRLTRALVGLGAPAPVRMVHIGLGNFHRAHQAWFTAHAPDAAGWGIAAFTGRRPEAALELAPQDGLFTLVTRSHDGDRFELVASVSAVHPAADHHEFLGLFRRPELSVVTLTVTEAGYRRGDDGRLDDTDPDVAADLDALRSDPTAPVGTLPGRLVSGLAARRAAGAGAGALTVLSCDNLPDNGRVTATVVADLADAVDPGLRAWMHDAVDFATSMVDRITPATTEADRELVAAAQGYRDRAPVVTEPFAEWVVAGRFPAGRPAWDEAGAQLVADVTPYERRKLWMLNGAHSLLAYAGTALGLDTVDAAVADPRCRGWVESWWDEAAAHLTLPPRAVNDYRSALLQRFANPRIAHRLGQIAADGSVKLPVRIVPVLLAERAAGRLPVGAATCVAAWTLHLRGHGAPLSDAGSGRARAAAAAADPSVAVRGVLDVLDPRLGGDAALVDLAAAQLRVLARP